MADYIPGSDTVFQAWAGSFSVYIGAHFAALGLTAPDDITPLSDAKMDFDGKMFTNLTAQQGAQSARQAKDDSRDALESVIRALVNRIQVSADVDDSERVALGITVRDTVRTPLAGDITTRPIGVVDTSQRLRHEIRFSDEATPTRRAKPKGIMGCEIWVKVLPAGEAPPVSADDLSFVTLDTASPYIAEYDGTDGGKTAHYMLRWVKSSGDKGPWSETVSATITA